MEKKLGKDTSDFKAFGDLWKFYQAYYITETTDEYWNDFTNDADKIIKNYPDVPVVRNMIMAIINEKESQLK